MSKEKISMPEIVDSMVDGRNINKKSAEEFVKYLLSTVENALIEGDVVKIKGLGTFKPQWKEPGKSIDEITGNEIVVDGYYNVIFAPEDELKEIVNEPFAHLEAVEFDADEDEDNQPEMPIDDVEPVKPKMEPMRVFEEQAEEIKGLLAEIGALPKKNDTQNETATIKTEEEQTSTEKSIEAEKNEIITNESGNEKEPEVNEPEIPESEEPEKEHKIEEEIELPVNDFDVVRDAGKVILSSIKVKNISPEIKTETVVEALPKENILTETKPIKEVEEVKEVEELKKNVIPAENIEKELVEVQTEELSDESDYRSPYFVDEVIDDNNLVTPKTVSNQENENNTHVVSENVAANKNQKTSNFESNVENNNLEDVKKRPVWIYILLFVTLLGLAAFAVRYFYPDVFNVFKSKTTQIAPEQKKVSNINPVEPTTADSLNNQTAKKDTIVNIFDTPRVYSEYIATEVMRKGSMLSFFAKKYLGHPYFWVYIYEANKDIIQDPNNVPLGAQIKIPKMDNRLIDVQNPECINHALKLSQEYLK
ncbi:MAG: histone family protein DNA-binding protein [Bacteroidetes bacterium]|nr:histone family protein DNA-binding protein [Bacteroidota bacterium]